MKLILSFFLLIFTCLQALNATQKPIIYFIPGQGSDYRIFSKLELDNSYEIKHIHYKLPRENMTMRDYAIELSNQIDTTRSYIIVGVSLGGMLASEMIEFLDPKLVIIISSAKSKNELPRRFRMQQKFPVYKSVPGKTAKKGAKIAQPVFEPDRRHEKEIFKAMLEDKDPEFLRRTIKMIVEWEKSTYDNSIVHIHGTRDKTIPIRNVSSDHIVKRGSHMITLTNPGVISDLINEILLKQY